MDLAALITEYGYAAVAVGTFFEGEAALLLAGFAVWRGHMEMFPLIVVASVATYLGDFLHYYAGRRYGPALLRRCPRLRAKMEQVHRTMHRHDLPLILSMRFLYGLRSPGLVALGMSGVSVPRFAFINLVSVILWAVPVAYAGYLFGGAIEHILARLDTWSLWFAGVLLLLLTAAWMLLRRRAPA